VALCPLVYGYVNYAAATESAGAPISFADAPRAHRDGSPGSTLGGTGIGISTRCKVTPGLLDHLRWLMSATAQTQFIPAHQGQPSRRSAWADDALNFSWGDFYRNTAETLERAYVRPRHAGAIAFQTRAAQLIRIGLSDKYPPRALLDDLQFTYERSRAPDAEI